VLTKRDVMFKKYWAHERPVSSYSPAYSCRQGIKNIIW
jgi:hypothetical protein